MYRKSLYCEVERLNTHLPLGRSDKEDGHSFTVCNNEQNTRAKVIFKGSSGKIHFYLSLKTCGQVVSTEGGIGGKKSHRESSTVCEQNHTSRGCCGDDFFLNQ